MKINFTCGCLPSFIVCPLPLNLCCRRRRRGGFQTCMAQPFGCNYHGKQIIPTRAPFHLWVCLHCLVRKRQAKPNVFFLSSPFSDGFAGVFLSFLSWNTSQDTNMSRFSSSSSCLWWGMYPVLFGGLWQPGHEAELVKKAPFLWAHHNLLPWRSLSSAAVWLFHGFLSAADQFSHHKIPLQPPPNWGLWELQQEQVGIAKISSLPCFHWCNA